MEFTYLAFTRMPGESYSKRLRFLLLLLLLLLLVVVVVVCVCVSVCDVFRVLINSHVC